MASNEKVLRCLTPRFATSQGSLMECYSYECMTDNHAA